MKFFKKKKSDKDLSKPFESIVPLDIPVQAMSSPVLVMPKPRKFLTPTRAILGRFDQDKTQVEDIADEADMLYPQKISPILKLEDEEDFLNKLLNEQEAKANRALDSLSLAVKKLPVTKKKSFVMQPPTSLMPQYYNHQEIEREPVNFIQQENEQEQVLQALRKQIELMEQQRIKDREEWRIKEQELLDNRQKMMETLQQTKEQLNQVLKERDEAYQQQLLESPSMPQLEQDREEPKRTVNKSRSEEHLRTRSSSRSTYYEDYIPPRKIYYNDERSISRKSSSASTKSGYSPASTLVQRRRSRARSIDGKEIFMEDPRMYTKSPYYYDDEEEEEYHRYYWQLPPVYYHTRQQAVDYRRGYPRQQHHSYN